jgi:hypothetical protein
MRRKQEIALMADDDISESDLDALQNQYKAAAMEWIASIQHEIELASVVHSVANLDDWENAELKQGGLREKAQTAKASYEDGLRRKFFGF